ncbi:hypothetical protein E2C01_035859 [Portunus trituberculatus]|uniref:Uncharacterized protein n=1 Tax=Portunus trituberculatus TaxID=210409 RepID=A0A5B7F729_PORTR|nr:hypothetical protein [Portunus trituberculatus]
MSGSRDMNFIQQSLRELFSMRSLPRFEDFPPLQCLVGVSAHSLPYPPNKLGDRWECGISGGEHEVGIIGI